MGRLRRDLESMFGVLISELRAKLKELTSYREISECKLFVGRKPDAFKAELDDSEWERVTLPLKIKVGDDGCWLRFQVKVPSKVAGISVEGSAAYLSSSPIISPRGLKIYVNSRLVLSDKYWAELRGNRITLKKNVKPGESFLISVYVGGSHEPINIPAFSVTYSRVEELAFEIESFIHQLLFVKEIKKDVVGKIIEDLDFNVLKSDVGSVIAEIRRVKPTLLEASELAKKFKVHLVGHAHMDMNWLWDWENTINMIKSTFKTVSELMDKYHDLHFSQSQAVTYWVVENKFPELLESVKRKIRAGRWEVTASTWVEGDLNMGGNRGPNKTDTVCQALRKGEVRC